MPAKALFLATWRSRLDAAGWMKRLPQGGDPSANPGPETGWAGAIRPLSLRTGSLVPTVSGLQAINPRGLGAAPQLIKAPNRSGWAGPIHDV